jgi:acyl-coenzyme A thioesterase PaaI-like protein
VTIIQDHLDGNHCYGCGKENPDGMQIKSHWDGEVSVCRYEPGPEQSAGPTTVVYGGLIASLVDCHSVGTAMAYFYQREGRAIGSAPALWCVTARLTVNYRKPTPMGTTIELRARVIDSSEKKAVVETIVTADGEVVAEGETVAVLVPNEWRNEPAA